MGKVFARKIVGCLAHRTQLVRLKHVVSPSTEPTNSHLKYTVYSNAYFRRASERGDGESCNESKLVRHCTYQDWKKAKKVMHRCCCEEQNLGHHLHSDNHSIRTW